MNTKRALTLLASAGILLAIFGFVYQPLFNADCKGDACLQGAQYIFYGLVVLGIDLAVLLWIYALKFIEKKLPKKQSNTTFWKVMATLVLLGLLWLIFYLRIP